MLAAWIIFMFVSFGVSVLTGSYIQIRVAKRHGWCGLSERPLLHTYWFELSPVERILLWPGIVAFAITVLSATAWKVITSLA